MARPLKNNASWFPHFASLRNDRKIKAIYKRFNLRGYGIFNFLLEILTDSDFFRIETTDLNLELLAADLEIATEELRNFLDYGVSIGLFEQDSNKTYLWCPPLLVWLEPLLHAREKSRFTKSMKKNVFSKENEVFSKEFSKENEVFSKENEVFSKENEVFSKENEVFSKENTHSTVQYRNNSLRSLLSPSSPSSPVCVCETEQDKMVDIPMTAREGIEVLKKDRDWLLQMQRKFGLEAGAIVRWLDNFSVDCDCRGKQEHESLADVKQHFNDWMTKQRPRRTNGKKGAIEETSSLTSQQLWIKCQAELCQAVSPEECRQSFDVIRFERFEVSTSKLFIQVPNKETYEYMEHHLVHVMSRIIPKYFGNNFKLQYHLP